MSLFSAFLGHDDDKGVIELLADAGGLSVAGVELLAERLAVTGLVNDDATDAEQVAALYLRVLANDMLIGEFAKHVLFARPDSVLVQKDNEEMSIKDLSGDRNPVEAIVDAFECTAKAFETGVTDAAVDLYRSRQGVGLCIRSRLDGADMPEPFTVAYRFGCTEALGQGRLTSFPDNSIRLIGEALQGFMDFNFLDIAPEAQSRVTH